ncbi:MAG: hypothetical protein QNI88_03820 [Desulfobacterales bacterium]|nr:hypothetical protein [Desulfobacterales bacterium]
MRVEGHGFGERFDGAILATPLPEAMQVVRPWLDPGITRLVPGWPHASALLVHMSLQRQFRRPALQVLPPRDKAEWGCGFTVERAKSALRVTRGGEAVTLYARPEKLETLWKHSDDDIAATLADELANWLVLPRHEIVVRRVRRWPYAAASCDTGADQRSAFLKAQLNRLARQIPIWAAGDYLGLSSLEGAVASANEAARACRIHFQSQWA